MFMHGFDASLVCQKIVEELLCKDEFNNIDLMPVFWCRLQGNYWIFMPIVVLALLVIFKYVSITVEEYIAGAIQSIADNLNMSDSVAAITLLAAANGAADMMTVLIASDTEDGISYNIGTLYGSGLFVCCAVFGICIVSTEKKLKFNCMIVYRLIVFYVLATLITVGFALYKQITWWGSLLLLALYLILITVVIADDWRTSKTDHVTISMNAGSHIDSNVDSKDKDDHQLPKRLHSKIFEQYHKVVDSDVQEDNLYATSHSPASSAPVRMMRQNLAVPSFIDYTYKEPHSLIQEYGKKIDLAKLLRKTKHKRLGVIGYIIMIIEKPFIWLLWLTVLPCDKEQYSRKRCLAYAFPGMIFAVMGDTRQIDLFTLSLSCGLGFLLFLFFTLLYQKRDCQEDCYL